MPLLDPVLHHPSRTGPSRDYKAIAALEPVYRQEAFQLLPKRLPVSMNANLKPRPWARPGNSPDTHMPLFRIPVLVRQSNQRPQEAGTSNDRGNWSLSDPSHNPGQDVAGASDMLPGMGEEALPGGPAISMKTILTGLGVGVAVYFLMGKRKG